MRWVAWIWARSEASSDRRHDHVGSEREISAFEQEALRFGLRLGDFDAAPRAAPDVE